MKREGAELGFDLGAGFFVNAVGGVALLGLAAFVAYLRPSGPANLPFAVLTGAFGLAFIFHWTVPAPDEPLLPLWFIPAVGGVLIAAGAGILVALRFPTPIPEGSRHAVTLAGLVAVVGAAVMVPLTVTGMAPFLAPNGYTSANRPWVLAQALAVDLLLAVLWGIVALLGLRFAREPPTSRSPLALAGAALVVWPAFTTGVGLMALQPSLAMFGNFRALGLGGAGPMAATVALWLWAGNKTGSPGPRRIVHLTLAAALAGMVFVALFPSYSAALRGGGFGLARMASVLILAYAILRHQLLGIDVKVRWTLSKTTLAGILVAAFFIVSEGAQQFFGERAENQYLGILAAGALVFAIAPLSRFADRIAARAVPLGAGTVPAAPDEAFKAAVRAARRDGQIGRDEERHLADVADHLGIGTRKALALREEVEREPTVRPTRAAREEAA